MFLYSTKRRSGRFMRQSRENNLMLYNWFIQGPAGPIGPAGARGSDGIPGPEGNLFFYGSLFEIFINIIFRT